MHVTQAVYETGKHRYIRRIFVIEFALGDGLLGNLDKVQTEIIRPNMYQVVSKNISRLNES